MLKFPCKQRSEFGGLATDCHVREIELALGQEIPDIAVAQREPEYSQTTCWMTAGGKRWRA